MDYFSKFLRPNFQPPPKQVYNHVAEFHRSWTIINETLTHPDERQLARGINATGVPVALKAMVDALVWESTRTEEGLTGVCMEYLLKNDVLGTLVRLSEPDRPSGIQVEVLRTVQSMVVLLDEQFLVHSVVHRAVLRLLKTCVGDDIQEQLDGRNRVMGAAGNAVRASPTEYEEDLVDLLCLLCSRIRTFRELLMIFFYDKHWYHSEALKSVPEEDDEEEEEDEGGNEDEGKDSDNDEKSTNHAKSEISSSSQRAPSPTPSQATVTSAPVSSQTRKPEYEFILLNYLLRFVHREGKIGEFARAGLLFLMDVAMSPGVPVHRIGGEVPNPSTSAFMPSQSSGSDPVADAALALAEYILDGDFCEVLGAGLGAVYSLLPSKLEIRMEHQENPSQQNAMTIGGAGPLTEADWEKQEIAQEKARSVGMEDSSSPEFKARLEHFVKLLEFLQDVLRRNVASIDDDGTIEPASFVGSAIVQSILDAVRRIFLENVLYPTILECSDADGSAVAIMSYIDVMFRSVQDPQFAESLIDFLVTEDDTDSLRYRPRTRPTMTLDSTASAPPPTSSTREKKAKRRKSSAMMLLEMDAPDARRQSEYFTSMGRFTLKDLLLTNMRSKSHAAVAAALQLMQTLLVHHCHLTVDRLFIFSYDPIDASSPPPSDVKELSDDDEEAFSYPGAETEPALRQNASFFGPEPVSRIPETSYSMHEQELGLYLGLVARIDPAHGRGAFSTGYDHYLRDALISIAGHSCSTCATDISDKPRPRHLLDVNDPVLSLILQSLRHFYSNTPEQNMSLTGMLAAIASCPERSLKGWLLFGTDGVAQPSKKESGAPQFSDDGDDRSVDFGVNERLMRNELPMPIYGAGPLSQPVVLSILQGLVSNLDRFRDLVQQFDSFLAERRQGLVFSENLTDALSISFDLSNNVIGIANLTSSPTSGTTTPSHSRSKSKSRSGWASFLTPKKGKSQSASFSRSESPVPSSKGKTIEASPFGSHYRKTSEIVVEPLVAPIPASGPWVPMERRTFNMDEEDVFGGTGQWGDEKRSESILQIRGVEQEETERTVAAPIILWNPKAKSSIESDDAGNKIVKTTLAPPIRAKPLYEAFDPGQPKRLCYVPRLTSFCIRALSKYPEQLHQLGQTRLIFQRKKRGGDNDVLRAVLPKWKNPDFSLLNVDPRLWATIVQVYRNPPEILSSYPMQLSDQYVPLLNQIPATPDFTLITVLDLNGSMHITDDTILSLKPLHNLSALDVSRCMDISARGIEKLSRTLRFDEMGEKRGPWALRVLKMRYFYAVNRAIFNCLDAFPLLTCVDLRDTSCKLQDIQQPFKAATDMDLFDFRMSDTLIHLSEIHKGVFPNVKPFILSVSDKPLPSMAKQPEPLHKKKFHSNHGSFILLPPSKGASFTGRPMTGPIQYGNVDAIEFKRKQEEKEAYLAQKRMREEYSDDCTCQSCYGSDVSEEDLFEYNSDDSESDDSEQALQPRTSLFGPTQPYPYRGIGTIDEEAHAAASTEAFYRRRPSYSPPRQRGEPETASSLSLALVRLPPNWNTLDIISSDSQVTKRSGFTTDRQEDKKDKESKLTAQKKRKASLHAFQSVLSKRRRPPPTVEMSNNTLVNYPELSPPPSPTATVCNTTDMLDGSRLTLLPSSNIRPSPQSVFTGTPRLKLEPAPKRPATMIARGLNVAPHDSSRSRQSNLAEGLKIQAQKYPRPRPSGSALFSFSKKPPGRSVDSDPTRSRKPFNKDKGTKKPKSAAAKSGGFDWSSWRKEG